ncbi:MAG: hypothetical protein PHT02_07350 [Tissierellia bacterium]|nr:hypothetical protein [Tissierellia bacterium]
MKKRKTAEWSKLDNAAKIFPPNSKKSDTKVFRFACKLKEQVDKDVLQKALDITIEAFPLYKSIIKSGLFWYYFEKSEIKPMVTEENTPPCSPLFNRDKKDLLFRVMYHKSRISVEIYHALSDGTGALQFLRTLVFHYILLKYPDAFKDNVPILDYDASKTQKMDDSFSRYYTNKKSIKNKKRITAYQIRGIRLPEYRIKVIEGVMPVDDIMQIVKSYNTSLTIFLAAILMCSINEEIAIRHKKSPVVLSIPVNLRKYFNSETARNFFGVISVDYNFSDYSGDFVDVINHLENCFKENLTPEKLSQRINLLSSLEHNYLLRIIPLKIKDIVLRIANNIVDKSNTSTLSNVGKIDMPAEIKPFISSFDIFVSTNKLQACICSYDDKLRVSFTSAFISTDIQRRFFRTLTSLGIPIDIITNKIDDE